MVPTYLRITSTMYNKKHIFAEMLAMMVIRPITEMNLLHVTHASIALRSLKRAKLSIAIMRRTIVIAIGMSMGSVRSSERVCLTRSTLLLNEPMIEQGSTTLDPGAN